jgi:outer membrane protein
MPDMSVSARAFACRTAGVCLLCAVASCAPSLPGPGGARPVAVRSDTLWVPPPLVPPSGPEAPAPLLPRDLPPDIAAHRSALTLEDVIALALAGSPDARASWALARAQAAAFGAARGGWFPEVTGELSATRLKTAATQGRSAVQQTLYQPSASFTWLLLDVGGRGGETRAARSALLAADWTHNATLQNVVATTAAAYFDYAAAKALLNAQQLSLREAELNLAAAEERRRVGVATIADVLQARTAAAQARLDLQTLEGNLLTTRGALAAASGFPATLEYDIDTTAAVAPVMALSEQIDTLIATALRVRPDLAAARSEYEAARARIAAARAQRLPSLTASGTAGLNFRPGVTGSSNSYTVSLGLQIPLFNGFIWEYNQRQAEAQAEAARARADGQTQQVIFQVFQAYYALRTATTRVGTADELLASATESANAARGRYEGGVGTLLELLSAENALATARAQRIQARLGWQAALVQLAQSAGLLDLRGGSPLRLMPLSAPPDSSR